MFCVFVACASLAVLFAHLSLEAKRESRRMTDINARDDEGRTILARAAVAGDVDEVARLLADKAEIDLADNIG